MTTARVSPRVARGLGVAGLIPFVAPAALLLLDFGPVERIATVVDIYALTIICFLCGSWWAAGLASDDSAPLVASNFVFLLAFFTYLLLPHWWPLGAALLLVILFFAENATRLLAPFPPHYRRLRALLTLVAALSMLSVQIAR